jgi:SAM-dependent methyltransferase
MTQPVKSFRDPAGCCSVIEGRVLRFIATDAAGEFEAFVGTELARDFENQRRLVSTHRLNANELEVLTSSQGVPVFPPHTAGKVFEHEHIPFPSYPYEWPPEMLWEAGLLTLDLARISLHKGYGLKDATPYNILFRGSEAVFIDVPSFERRTPGDVLWKPYAQFVRTFLLPLLANKRWGLRLVDIFTMHRDGLEPEEVYHLCGLVDRLKPQIISLVCMPTWLSRKAGAGNASIYQQRTLSNTEKAHFILESLFKRLQRSLNSLKPAEHKSVWSNYMTTHSYSDPAFALKEKFVTEVLQEFKPKRVLDAGANTGRFSELAAQAGSDVVAIDLDPVCVGAIWRRARTQKLNILPLVLDLGRPSPALGWKNSECLSFLDRASGHFDGLLMLALIHHLLVTERIPLDEILHLAAELTTSLLVIEFVAPQDAMFRQLTRGRDDLHASLDTATFEQACAVHFDLVRSAAIPDTKRRLYCLRKKASLG